MNVTINKPKCLRSGQCTYLHPELFKEGEGGYPELIVSNPIPDELKEAADDAADICPSGAIDLEE